MINLSVLKDASEIVHYDNVQFPVYIKKGDIAIFKDYQALCHWHEDIEFVKVIKGELDYFVDGKHFVIKEQDGLLVNSKAMHYGYSKDKVSCLFYCILWKPSLLCNTELIQNSYIQPLLNHSNPVLELSSSNKAHQLLLEKFDQMQTIYEKKVPGYELLLLGLLHMVWLDWYHIWETQLSQGVLDEKGDLLQQRQMVDYIYRTYQNRITLMDIAGSANICRSKCCELFKKYVKKSPMNFLNAHRLEVSMNLLMTTDLPITEVAFACGFQNPSYFSEMFLKYKGCTPKQFRLHPKPSFEDQELEPSKIDFSNQLC